MGYSQRDVSETALSLQYHDNDFIKKQCEKRFHSFTCLKTINIQNHAGETAVALRFHPPTDVISLFLNTQKMPD